MESLSPAPPDYLGHYVAASAAALAEEDPALATALRDMHVHLETRLDLTAGSALPGPSVAAARASATGDPDSPDSRVVRSLVATRARGLFDVPAAALRPGDPRSVAERLDATALFRTMTPGAPGDEPAEWRAAADRAGVPLIVDTTAVTRLIVAGISKGPRTVADFWLTQLDEETGVTLVLSDRELGDEPVPPPAAAAVARLLGRAATDAYGHMVRRCVSNADELAAELRLLGVAAGSTAETVTVPVPDGASVRAALAEAGVLVGGGDELVIGVRAATARGFGPAEMRDLARLITQLRWSDGDFAGLAARAAVRRLLSEFPVPRRAAPAW